MHNYQQLKQKHIIKIAIGLAVIGVASYMFWYRHGTIDKTVQSVHSTEHKEQHQNLNKAQSKTIQKNTIDNDEKKYVLPEKQFPVQAFIRMRPLVGLEISENHETIKYNIKKSKKNKTQSITLKNVYGRNNKRDKKYTGFKQIISPNMNNLQTFNKCILSSVSYVLNGVNVCVFAYGHTGSGKTHTIFGYDHGQENVPGMYQLFSKQLFDKVIHTESDIFLEIRFCELYQGNVYDLLSEDKRE
eukprot:523302_1